MIFPKADLHIHPLLKAYGHSFYTNNNPDDASSGASPWFRDPDTFKDDAIENIFGFAPYRQSDFTSCKRGNLKVIVNSFYSIEQGFLLVKNTELLQTVDKAAGKTLADAITEFGKDWIEKIRSSDYNYFTDLIGQMDYCNVLQNKIPVNGVSRYRVLPSAANFDADVRTGDLLVMNSVEGAQSLCNGNNPGLPEQWQGIEERIRQVKAHPCRPFYVTLAHHFYNGLCSHCESLFDLEKIIVGQQLGMSTLKTAPISSPTEITPLGLKVIDLLLSEDNGSRVLIDIKHMSKGARTEFYAYRKEKYPGIPIIYSHGACRKFYDFEINIDEEDITQIAASGGIIGIEMDQRVLGYNDAMKGKRAARWAGNLFRSGKQRRRLWADIVWENMLHIAETCYQSGFRENPWQYVCIGSDYDGIINPVNEFRTIDTLADLLSTLQEYLTSYWSDKNAVIPEGTGGDVSDIIYQIGYGNLVKFIKLYFK